MLLKHQVFSHWFPHVSVIPSTVNGDTCKQACGVGGGEPPRGPAARAQPARACAVLTDRLRDPASPTHVRGRSLYAHTASPLHLLLASQRRSPKQKAASISHLIWNILSAFRNS